MLEHIVGTEESLANSAELRAFLEGLGDAAVVVDADLRPLAWNRSYLNAVGLRSKRFARTLQQTSKRCCDFFELEVCHTDCLAQKAFASGRSVRMDELRGSSKHSDGGHEYRLIVNAVPLRNSEGEIVAVLEMYRDVTAEARIQERYKQLLAQERQRAEVLEQKVRERTADLEKSLEELRATRAQLVQSEKLSALGQLTAGLAHEINNPVNFIYGNTDFLAEYITSFQQLISLFDSLELSPTDRERVNQLKEELDYQYISSDVEKLLGSIRSGAERAAAIIANLRSFMHGSGEESAPVDIERCIRATVGLIHHEVRDRIEISTGLDSELPLVRGNAGQLNQVLMNLLVNAIHAIEGAGHIDVTAQQQQDGNVHISVQDDGCGMTEEQQLKVFDPFFTTKPVGQGTGLGLSISYSIIHAHGGSLSVSSRPGEGTAFTIILPVHRA